MQVQVPGRNLQLDIYGYSSSEDEYVSGNISKNHNWELNNVKKICDSWPPCNKKESGGNFLDIGANIGAWTLPVASCIGCAGGGEVFAVEAMPSIANHLKAGIVENGLENVVLYPYALADPTGPARVEIALNARNKGGSAVVGNKDWTKKKDTSVYTVPTTTIDDMLQENPGLQKLRAMKVDIEGNEGLALAGATALLSKYPPCTIVIEMVSEWLKNSGSSYAAVSAQLKDAGYEVPSGKDGTFWLNQVNMPTCLARLAA